LNNRTVFHWKQLIKSGFPFIKVSVIRDSFEGVDASGWREILAEQGYDVSLAERTLVEAATSSPDNSAVAGVRWPLLSSSLSAAVSSRNEISVWPDIKTLHIENLEARLQTLLASPRYLEFLPFEKPEVSIILVLFNKAHFTFACLESLHSCLKDASFRYEIIAIDNGSTDLTSSLLDRCANLIVHKCESNLGFLHGVNAASKSARGEYLLLLNNDTELCTGAVENALHTISASHDIGAVGAKLILPDGTLQEAGSIIWSDGTCLGYCRGNDPDHFEANFRRDVDYCSGAFLLTRADLFGKLGRFNPIFAPAYYEETDYCIRLWEAGFRVVYDPSVVVFHFEFASAENNEAASEAQTKNQAKFRRLHEETLRRRLNRDSKPLFARQAGRRKLRLLFVDDFVPHQYLGAGFPRAKTMIDGFLTAGTQITLCPTLDKRHSWKDVRRTLDPSVEVAFEIGHQGLRKFIKDRQGFYDAVLVSRPHNMVHLNSALEDDPDLLQGSSLIYDAEALFTDRAIALRSLRGDTVSEDERKALLYSELQIARFASTIICVSPNESNRVADWRDKDVRILGHTIQPLPHTNSFQERADVLFVGAIHGEDSPNADSVIWFIDEIFPLLKEAIARPFKFIIAGLNRSSAVERRLNKDIVATGPIGDLTPFYARSRIFVAPTRFAAGIPHKVHEAAGRGVPCVVTPLLLGQLGWTSDKDVLVGGDAKAFAQACANLYTDPDLWIDVRNNALEAMKRDCDPLKFSATLSALHDQLVKGMRKN
jgi:O-antigen biosynthesis protein